MRPERMMEVGFMLSENVSVLKGKVPVSDMAAGKSITKEVLAIL
jgi:hypothetical protein